MRLPPLVPYDGEGLEPDGDYDGLRVRRDAIWRSRRGAGARFMDCALEGCALDETELTRARCMDSVLTGVRGVGTDLAEASLRDVELVDARLGGVQLHGAVLERVRGARREDRLPESAQGPAEGRGLRGLRARPSRISAGAQLERVEFRDCVLKRADFSAVRMEDVDLRTVAELDIARGVERLAGAVISPAQLMDLAPVFAAQIGVRVEG